jgi:hypothetical protein
MDHNPASVGVGANNNNGSNGPASKLETIGGSTTTVTTFTAPGTPPLPLLIPLQPRKANRLDPIEQEQILFEQRLCEDGYGVAVRKINQNGKSNLRYVKCIYRDNDELQLEPTAGERRNSGNHGNKSTRSVSSRSVGSWGGRKSGNSNHSHSNMTQHSHSDNTVSLHPRRVLVWGKKKDVQIPIERFVSVYKGKITDRTKRNTSPGTRVLSLLTDDPNHPSLDIEAPTRLDRDKFARAFARFLDVPVQGDDVLAVTTVATTPPPPPPTVTATSVKPVEAVNATSNMHVTTTRPEINASLATTETDMQQQQLQQSAQTHSTISTPSSAAASGTGLPPKSRQLLGRPEEKWWWCVHHPGTRCMTARHE